MKRNNIQWKAKQLAAMYINGSVVFDNAVQRGIKWDLSRKSLLIDSMIQGYPVPPFYARRGANKEFDMLDGKQRSTAIKEYINNEFALDCGEYEGCTYIELPEEVKVIVSNYSLTVFFYEEITDQQVNEMFFRLNNGKTLTAVELTRVKAKSFEVIRELAKHEIFTECLSEKQRNNYMNEDIIIKAFAMLSAEDINNVSLETKVVRPLMRDAEITDKYVEMISKALDTVKAAHELIVSGQTKSNMKVAKKVYTRTHLVSILPYALQFDAHDQDEVAKFSEWLKVFYGAKSGASISSLYNTYSSASSNYAISVKTRNEELNKSFTKFMEG